MTRFQRLPTARIAVDLLGGDHAPAVVVDGALLAGAADPDLHLHLVGPPEAADQVQDGLPEADRARVSRHAVRAGVGMADAPVRAARPETSVRAAVAALAAGTVHGVVSAGATGAIVTAAVLGLGRSAGVAKPALAALVPARSGPVVLLDVGACPDAASALLVSHAELGARYATALLGCAAPRVGLLSIGTEPGKGDRVRRIASEALAGRPGYIGAVEGSDVALGGRADVVVTDGFTGNVLLKGMEGAYELAGGTAPGSAVPRAAALLGVPGVVVVCHGSATAPDIASGIALAARLYRVGLPDVLAGPAPGRPTGRCAPAGSGRPGGSSRPGRAAPATDGTELESQVSR